MGYTIYWKTNKGKRITKKEAEECVSTIRKIIEENKEFIDIEFKDKDANNKYNINFNGVGGDDNQHETFVFYTDYIDENDIEQVKQKVIDNLGYKEDNYSDDNIKNGILKFKFCKTARKYYDYFVKEALIEMQKITNNKFEVSCDDGFIYDKDGVIVDKESKPQVRYDLINLRETDIGGYTWQEK